MELEGSYVPLRTGLGVVMLVEAVTSAAQSHRTARNCLAFVTRRFIDVSVSIVDVNGCFIRNNG